MTEHDQPGVDALGPAWTERVRRSDRPCVVLLCGLTGSGKTRLAHALERDLPALRFTVDEWMIALFGEHMPREVHDRRLAQLVAIAWDTAERAATLGVHVVLDYGFWRRTERLEAAKRARDAGATPLLVYLDVPQHELERRLAARNAAHPEGSYVITPDMLELFAGWFEPPSEDEGIPLTRLWAPADGTVQG